MLHIGGVKWQSFKYILKKRFTRGRYEKQENVRLSILRIGVKYT